MDIRMEGMSGLEALETILGEFPHALDPAAHYLPG